MSEEIKNDLDNLKQQLVGLNQTEWIGFLNFILFEKTEETLYKDIDELLSKVSFEIELKFRAIYNLLYINHKGNSLNCFYYSIIYLIRTKPINDFTKYNIEFLIRYIKIIKPISYRGELMTVLVSREEQFLSIEVDEDYSCLQLLLDSYLVLATKDDDTFERFLYTRVMSKEYFASYLVSYYLQNKNTSNSNRIISNLLNENKECFYSEKQLYWVYLKLSQLQYIHFNWRAFFLTINAIPDFKDRSSFLLLTNTFINRAIEYFNLRNKSDLETLPNDLFFLLYIKHLLDRENFCWDYDRVSQVVKNSMPNDLRRYEESMKDELFNDVLKNYKAN